MWISNTATAMMMLPIALLVVHLFIGEGGTAASSDRNRRNFATVMMLAVAYGANIGGIATLIGTPPNTVMAGILENTFGQDRTSVVEGKNGSVRVMLGGRRT